MIEELRNNKARIIISGEPFDKDKSLMVHLFTENLAVNVARVAKSGSVTIALYLTGLGGFHIVMPKLFSENMLRVMQYGLLLTDGSINKKGYPEMGTNQLWQVIAWLMAWPGSNYMRIDGVGVNDCVGITWNLMAIDHKGVFWSKAEVAEEVSKLVNDDFMVFLFFAVLGDGYVDVKKELVRLYMGELKHKLWGNIIERLRSLGFRERNEKHKITYVAWSSRAVNLIRKMLSDALIKALIEDLSTLPDAEKLRNLITLSSMRIKPKGKSSIEVVGVKMNVGVNNKGIVELKVTRKDCEEARAILDRLKSAGYEETKLSKRGSYFVVYMGMDAIRKHPELAAKVCEVLKRMLDEAIREDNKKRAWGGITKAMTKLNCPRPKPTGMIKTLHL
ncbi:hypothetical protein [Vulcanisaeta distributa]|uniref:hypothetical protein n=1 Tax=Vulcanisaeta distributa TaxID=164451 RepID=UPI000A7C2408|nr:hypothetical protein [Vulcanisaeta distributa]